MLPLTVDMAVNRMTSKWLTSIALNSFSWNGFH